MKLKKSRTLKVVDSFETWLIPTTSQEVERRARLLWYAAMAYVYLQILVLVI